MIYFLFLSIVTNIVIGICLIYIRNERDMMWVPREDHLKILEDEVDHWIKVVETMDAKIKKLQIGCEGAYSALLLAPHVDKQKAIDYLKEVLEIKDA